VDALGETIAEQYGCIKQSSQLPDEAIDSRHIDRPIKTHEWHPAKFGLALATMRPSKGIASFSLQSLDSHPGFVPAEKGRVNKQG